MLALCDGSDESEIETALERDHHRNNVTVNSEAPFGNTMENRSDSDKI